MENCAPRVRKLAGDVAADLRILATSDIHMALTGWNYFRDVPEPRRGLSRLAERIQTARRDAPGATVLLDNGDALHGTPLGDVAAEWPVSEDHPWIICLRTLGYDAIGLGNHDFDYGLHYVEALALRAPCPVIATTMIPAPDHVIDRAILKRDLLCSDERRRTLRIGILSTLPPQTAFWNKHLFPPNVTLSDQRAAISTTASELRTQGADLVVVLAHTGVGDDAEDTENAALGLARIDDIDALILGHTHLHIPGPDHTRIEGLDGPKAALFGKPTIMPGHSAEHIAQLDLRLRFRAGQGWRVSGHKACLVPASPNEAPVFKEHLSKCHERTRGQMALQLSETPRTIHSYFSFLRPDGSLALLAAAMQTTLNRCVASGSAPDLPVLAAVAPQASGGRGGPENHVLIPRGPIRRRHIAQLCPFRNSISAIVLDGISLRAWIERAVSIFLPEAPSRDVGPLIDATMPGFNFDVVHGVQATIDPLRPPRFCPRGRTIDTNAGRVTKLLWQGRELDPDQRFLLAMTSYRAAGGGHYPGLPAADDVIQTGVPLENALIDFIRREGLPSDEDGVAWHFAPGRNVSAWIDVPPSATDHLDEIIEFSPRVMHRTAEGFTRLEVRL